MVVVVVVVVVVMVVLLLLLFSVLLLSVLTMFLFCNDIVVEIFSPMATSSVSFSQINKNNSSKFSLGIVIQWILFQNVCDDFVKFSSLSPKKFVRIKLYKNATALNMSKTKRKAHTFTFTQFVSHHLYHLFRVIRTNFYFFQMDLKEASLSLLWW